MTEISCDPVDFGPDPIAVIGAACRVPGAEDVEAFWDLIRDGRDAITRVPRAGEHGATSVWARGQIGKVDEFDAAFFGFSQADARLADPQIRLLLEVGYHAYEASGRLRAQDCVGVFASCGISTYLLNNLMPNPWAIDDWAGVSSLNDKDFAATRLAYALNATGPAMSVQTACSSSLVGIHVACESLLSGECDTSLVAGASIHLPHQDAGITVPKAISATDGYCRAFDAAATGTVFGDGVVAVVLRRLDDALRDGDQILAIIVGTSVNNDGRRKPGFMSPSVEGQRDCLLRAMDVSGVTADSIGLIEAHGTGTPLGDPIELSALRDAWQARGTSFRPCAVGSVKTNIGHLGEAAGLAGFLKCVLCVKHGVIPPSLHFRVGNPAFDWERASFYVPTNAAPWTDEQRIGVITSLGLGGTNANVLVSSFNPADGPSSAAKTGGPTAIRLSAATSASLGALAASVRAAVSVSPADVHAISDELNLRRRELPYRAAASGRDTTDLMTALRQIECAPAIQPILRPSTAVFAFAGQGSLEANVLFDFFGRAEFQAHFDRAAAALHSFERDRIEIRSYDDAAATAVARTDVIQPLLYAIQTFLVDRLRAAGVRPAAVAGHSAGELAALYAAEVIGLAEGMAFAARRGAAMQELAGPGAMAAVFADAQTVIGLVEGKQVAIAAYNSADSCVISGPDSAIEEAMGPLRRAGMAVRQLPVGRAFHTTAMSAAADVVARLGDDMRLTEPGVPFVSTVTGAPISLDGLGRASYWRDQVLAPVRFLDAVSHIDSAFGGPHVWFEIGFSAALTPFLVVDALPNLAGTVAITPASLLRQGMPGLLAQSWALGLEVGPQPPEWLGRRVPVSLPYPFDRHSHWISAPGSPLSSSQHEPPVASDGAPVRVQIRTEDDVLELVLAAWSEGLGVKTVAPDADFFQLGGHSLAMIGVIERLQGQLYLESVPKIRELIATPTPTAMAKLLWQRLADE